MFLEAHCVFCLSETSLRSHVTHERHRTSRIIFVLLKFEVEGAIGRVTCDSFYRPTKLNLVLLRFSNVNFTGLQSTTAKYHTV